MIRRILTITCDTIGMDPTGRLALITLFNVRPILAVPYIMIFSLDITTTPQAELDALFNKLFNLHTINSISSAMHDIPPRSQ